MLRYLKTPKTIPNISSFNTTHFTTNTTIGGNNNLFGPFITLLLLALFYGFAYIMSGVSYVYNKWGFMWLGFIFIFIATIILFLYWNNQTYSYITSVIKEDKPKYTGKKISEINDRDLIKVVSRADFVAEYLGQSAPKTKALLYANLGKVLFIDEAYSLYNGERDQFGMEALTTLDLFMSEHPDSIAVIFAGYKDLMKYGIFRVQPGLPRRCMWHFECARYTGNELCDIFFRQAYQDGWAIRESDRYNIRQLISDNADIFKSYGGDTERLLFFSKLEVSRNNMMSTSYKTNYRDRTSNSDNIRSNSDNSYGNRYNSDNRTSNSDNRTSNITSNSTNSDNRTSNSDNRTSNSDNITSN